MDRLLFLLMTPFLDIVASTSTSGVKYTLYGVQRTWNEARTTCETHGQVMLKLDSVKKYNDFITIKSVWEGNGQLKNDMWMGLHQHQLSDPSVFNLEWHDCDSFSVWNDWAAWSKNEPDKPDTELCVRLTYSGSSLFRTRDCDVPYQVVCQEATGRCSYEEFEDKKMVSVLFGSELRVTLEECKQLCLTFSSGTSECVAIRYTNAVCEIHTGTAVYINSQPQLTSQLGTSTYIKRCVEGEYKSAASSVEDNTAKEPITACPSIDMYPSTTYMSSYMTSISSLERETASTPPISLSAVSFPSLETAEKTRLSLDLLTLPQQNTVSSEIIFLMATKATSSETTLTRSYLDHTDVDTSIPSSHIPQISSTQVGNTSTILHKSVETYASSGTDVNSGVYVLDSSSQTIMIDGFGYGSVSFAISSDDVRLTESASTSSLKHPREDGSPTTTHRWDTGYSQTSPVYNSITSNLSGYGVTTVTVCGCICLRESEHFMVIYNTLKYLVNRRNLSSYRRSKTSAEDHRLSAKVIGSSGISLIFVAVILVVCMDLDKLVRAFGRKKR